MQAERKRFIGLAAAVVLISSAILVIERPWDPSSSAPPPPDDIPEWALEYPAAPDFAGGGPWINSEPLDLVELRGQVVLVDFWTYSCINCIHTFPHLNAWYEHYSDHGLVVVGVHTPEFRFERDAGNVRVATERYNLTHPVVLDNEYDIWGAYHNRFWPAKYLVDQWGRIRYTHFGEGAYDTTEDTIRALLAEAGHDLPAERAPAVDTTGGVSRNQTPELYAAAAQGYQRVSIGNQEGYHQGQTITYDRPGYIARDEIYLVGTWFNGEEKVVARDGNASVIVKFRAGAMNFVTDGRPSGACVEVTLDGEPVPEDVAARDIHHMNATGNTTTCVILDEPRSYDVYAGPVQQHLVELRVPEGFSLYAFAFSEEGRT